MPKSLLYCVTILIELAHRDDNRLRTYLEEKGVIKTKQQATRDEMLAKMKGVYTGATDPVYHAWHDSYMVRTFGAVQSGV